MKIREGLFKEGNERVAESAYAVGSVALLLKDEEKAQSALKQSLDIRMKLLGKDHPLTM